MELVRSKDGTEIAYAIKGSGAPLLLVHGMLSEHSRWDALRPLLEDEYRVAAMDRRWRGGSGNVSEYSFARESEDIAAVVEALGDHVHVLAHSFGAMATLEASKITDKIASLMLYEPVLNQGPVDTSIAPVLAAIEAKALSGDQEGALRDFYRDFFRTPPEEVQKISADGYWEERKAVIHTCPREGLAGRIYRFDPQSVAHLTMPVLMLLGGASPPVFAQSADLVMRGYPNISSVVLPGQGHNAMVTAPEMLASEVKAFLAAQGAASAETAKI